MKTVKVRFWLERRDSEVAPTGVCRESEFPPTEELNGSAPCSPLP